jgi:hypothetical protein
VVKTLDNLVRSEVGARHVCFRSLTAGISGERSESAACRG